MSAQGPDQKPFTIALIGGGIGGLCLARALLNLKIPFHIYEAAHAFGEIGAGVALSINSRRAMQLIDPALFEGWQRRTTGNLDAEKKDTYFEYRLGMDARPGGAMAAAGFHRAGDKFAELKSPIAGFQSVHRAHFLDELINLVPAECASFGKRATRVEDRGPGMGVKIYFADGSEAEASAVVGTDGVKSHVRESLLGKEFNAVFSGAYAYRGLLDMQKAADLLGDAALSRNAQMYAGYGGHMLTFPIDQGATMNVVAFRDDVEEWTKDEWVIHLDRAEMESDFAGWGHTVRGILGLMEKPDVWALFNHPPAPTFYRGRICLAGDAAHATTPHQGAGAGVAIEDAYVLAQMIALAGTEAELEAAFAAYDAVRRPRGLELVETSRARGRAWGFLDPDVGDDPARFQAYVDNAMTWIWTEDLPAEVEAGRKKFNELMA